MGKTQTVVVTSPESYVQRKIRAWVDDRPSEPSPSASRHPLFQAAWRTVNLLLVVWILTAAYSIVWEYSTRRYLKGFADAVVPTSASPEAKAQAILDWMAHGPGRIEAAPLADSSDRDPTDTLNYESLLKVCGSATNAFINLSDSAGLPTRRLLLLDAHHRTKHVVAEILIDGRWIIVDPAFRTIFKGGDGTPLTADELKNSGTFLAAIKAIPRYDPGYTFDQVAHVRLSHIPLVGSFLRRISNRFFPQWEDWTLTSLILERESLAATFVAISLVLFIDIMRLVLRYYGETRLRIRSIRLRQQILRAFQAFLQTSD